MKKLAIMISGRGSNMAAILRAKEYGLYNGQVECVISNNLDAPGLAIARRFGVMTIAVAAQDRTSFEHMAQTAIDSMGVDLIVLAGFMRILSDEFVQKYAGQIINIHPSLLPKYKGLNTHARAIEAGDEYSGASVHYVNEVLDGGDVIEQVKVKILENDTPEALQQRVLDQEHHLYLRALREVCKER